MTDQQVVPRGEAARTLLVPLDGSELGDQVVPHVERLLGRAQYDVLLLRLVPPGAGERAPAEAHLRTVQRRLEGGGTTVTTLVREGDPAAGILSAIDERAPALVAMSSHGRGGVLRQVRGSVAERVLRACTPPLLVVTPRQGPIAADRLRRILVPLDLGDRAASVLPLVAELALAHEAEVVLLHVLPPGPPPVGGIALDLPAPEEVLGLHQRQLARLGVTARIREALGAPAGEILDVAEREQADLIAMATHGRAGLRRAREGSVCETVLRRARSPLLVVHAP